MPRTEGTEPFILLLNCPSMQTNACRSGQSAKKRKYNRRAGLFPNPGSVCDPSVTSSIVIEMILPKENFLLSFLANWQVINLSFKFRRNFARLRSFDCAGHYSSFIQLQTVTRVLLPDIGLANLNRRAHNSDPGAVPTFNLTRCLISTWRR